MHASMKGSFLHTGSILFSLVLLCACSQPAVREPLVHVPIMQKETEIADITGLPQDLSRYVRGAGDTLSIDSGCRDRLLQEFKSRYFAPWTSRGLLLDIGETKDFMRHEAHKAWYGANLRLMEPRVMRKILEQCDLESFPSRSERGVAVAPAHLRGLPTHLPLFEKSDGYPFDMLEYPQVKLNEPLRILHSSKDGVWLFVETPYTNGWIESRDVALVHQKFIDAWMQRPLAVVIEDSAAVKDEKSLTAFHAKIGTLLPVIQKTDQKWEVEVATAGEGGWVQSGLFDIVAHAAASYPLPFDADHISRIGNDLMGQPYGWGEMYGLRDCSALLRDFFLPFGIWMPRTSSDQIASVAKREDLSRLSPQEKEEVIKRQGVPFRTILYKPGHIMLYIGLDPGGRPLVYHDAWSVRVQDGEEGKPRMVGKVVVTTLQPGKELGLMPGSTILERVTSMATVTDRCQ